MTDRPDLSEALERSRAVAEALERSDVAEAISSEPAAPGRNADDLRCVSCGISIRVAGVWFDADQVCGLCRHYQRNRERIEVYFGTLADLKARLLSPERKEFGSYDCLLLYSGGKDSTYVLHQLIALGLRVLTFTFDNGYISPRAFANIERVTRHLGVTHVTCRPETVKEALRDSIERFDVPCRGCFKGLLDTGIAEADRNGIPFVVTGLSRGQIIDERLQWFYERNIFDPHEIDRGLAQGRRIYHQSTEFEGLPRWALGQARALDRVQVVDFFRYSAVTKAEVLDYLRAKDSVWQRPDDCGFCSTNCLINDVGIARHQTRRGWHYYEKPTAWEVRLGHLDLESAADELKEVAVTDTVKNILGEIGCTGATSPEPPPVVVRCRIKPRITHAEVSSCLDRAVPNWRACVRIAYDGVAEEASGGAGAQAPTPRFVPAVAAESLRSSSVTRSVRHSPPGLRDHIVFAVMPGRTETEVRRALLTVLVAHDRERIKGQRGTLRSSGSPPVGDIQAVDLGEAPADAHLPIVQRFAARRSAQEVLEPAPIQGVIIRRGAVLPPWVLVSGDAQAVAWSRWRAIVSDFDDALAGRDGSRSYRWAHGTPLSGAALGEVARQHDLSIPKHQFRLQNELRGATGRDGDPFATVRRAIESWVAPIEWIDPDEQFRVHPGVPPARAAAQAVATCLGVRLVGAGEWRLPRSGLVSPLLDPCGRWPSEVARIQLVVELTSPPKVAVVHCHGDVANAERTALAFEDRLRELPPRLSHQSPLVAVRRNAV